MLDRGTKHTRTHSRKQVNAEIEKARAFLGSVLPMRTVLIDGRVNKLDTDALWAMIRQADDEAGMAFEILRLRAKAALTPKPPAETVTLPAPQAKMIVDLLFADRPQAPKRKRGRDRGTNWGRDVWIAAMVRGIAERGFAPTRNRGTREHSACAIVAVALAQMGIDLTERGVEEIWRRRPREPAGCTKQIGI